MSMRIAHLADVHLGYRAYNRVTRQGLNVREADVFNAFRQALAKLAEIEPDLIVIAGDLFHVVRPSNLCIDWTFREFLRLREKTKAPIVVIGGNHDSPRSIDTGCILDLLQNVSGTSVVHQDYRGVDIPELDTTVFCLCHRAVQSLSNLKLEPNPKSRYNVLTLHGTFESIAGSFYDSGPPITRSQIMDADWDYIALGHYHLFEKLADNAYYSGSLEYTSFNIWQEADKPKGFIEFDLDTRDIVKFHKTKTRDVVDLRPIEAAGLTAAEINQLIGLRVEGIKGGHTDKIVRLVVEDVARPVIHDLDYAAVRQLRAEALHFELQLRQAKRLTVTASGGSTGVRPLEQEWHDFAEACEVPGGVDRGELEARGLEYLVGSEP